jgi:hypothetical protein
VVAFLSQGHQKVQTDFVGYLANAAVSNAKSISDVKANVNTIMKQFGLSDAKLVKGITQAAEAGELPAEEAKAWLNGVRERTSAEFTGDRTEAVRDVEQTQDLEPLDTEQVEVEATDDEFETTEVD